MGRMKLRQGVSISVGTGDRQKQTQQKRGPNMKQISVSDLAGMPKGMLRRLARVFTGERHQKVRQPRKIGA